MSELLFGRDVEIASWVADRIPEAGPESFRKSTAIGVASGDRLIAGVVYHNYMPQHGTCELSMAADSPMWAKHDVIAGLLHYPFEQMEIYKLWTATPRDYTAALKVNLHIGFKREAVLAHHYGKKRHAVICRMLQPDYRRLYGAK